MVCQWFGLKTTGTVSHRFGPQNRWRWFVSGLASKPLRLFFPVWPQNRWRRFLTVWPQNLMRQFSPDWPQNWWQQFLPVWPQNWQSVSWLSLKILVCFWLWWLVRSLDSYGDFCSLSGSARPRTCFLVSSCGPCSGVFLKQRFVRWVLGHPSFLSGFCLASIPLLGSCFPSKARREHRPDCVFSFLDSLSSSWLS
jgi:hypothetical protein